jgi:PIN domain nuclease of toxin-antitoxin system
VKLLIDTHCWLWLSSEPEKLRPDVVDLLMTDAHDVYVSSATVWEIAIKHALGKLSLPGGPDEYVTSRTAAFGQIALPIDHRHALRVADLPPHHRDPFDRILVAQAQVEDRHLVTADPMRFAHDVRLLRASR